MHFPLANQLDLPCRLGAVLPGALHPGGRRYLPLLVLQLANAFELGVVDRHHRVDEALLGSVGSAQLVFLLSTIRLQQASETAGLFAESSVSGRPSTRPTMYGRVLAVPTWDTEREHLPYESLYTELLLDIGVGVVGVRTSATAQSLAESLGKARIEVGDWLLVERSRIDILAFSVGQ